MAAPLTSQARATSRNGTRASSAIIRNICLSKLSSFCIAIFLLFTNCMQSYEKIATVAIIYSIFVRFSFRLLLIACFVCAICGCIVDSECTSWSQFLLNIADKSHVGLAICKNTDHHVLAVL